MHDYSLSAVIGPTLVAVDLRFGVLSQKGPSSEFHADRAVVLGAIWSSVRGSAQQRRRLRAMYTDEQASSSPRLEPVNVWMSS
jgi:hypothetical protein